MLALALLAQGALLFTHSHVASPSSGMVSDHAGDGSNPGALPGDRDSSQRQDPHACGVCAALTACRAEGIAQAPCLPAGLLRSEAVAIEPVAPPREPRPAGLGARAPPSSRV